MHDRFHPAVKSVEKVHNADVIFALAYYIMDTVIGLKKPDIHIANTLALQVGVPGSACFLC